MPFDLSTITDVRSAFQDGDLLVWWTSSAPAGTAFQLYVNRKLAWRGSARFALIPYPVGKAYFDVGTVDPGEEAIDFGSTLPAPPPDRVLLEWTGGTFLDPDIAGFHVYRSPSAGASVSYIASVATIPAYEPGLILDGFGAGGFGAGGFGASASYYSWRSDPLATGVWEFDVRPFDAAGNEGPSPLAGIYTAAIVGPPEPPAPNAAGLRLRLVSYNPTTHVATLGWNASP